MSYYLIKHTKNEAINYNKLHDLFKNIGPCVHDSKLDLWIVKSGYDATQIKEKIANEIYKGSQNIKKDNFFIVNVDTSDWDYWLDQDSGIREFFY